MFVSKKISCLKIPHAASPVMVKILKFHEKCLFMMIFVLIVVLVLLIYNFLKKKSSICKMENTWLEMGWTVIPTFIMLMLMIPSLEVLYFSEESGGAFFEKKMKVVGHQWYWSYEEENTPMGSVKFDSYIMKDVDLLPGEFRKCEVDRPLIFEYNSATRLLMTSADVIHSWAIPEFGVKVDAIPGRLNQMIMYSQSSGRFFGFCSELCGVNHSFMPMVVEVMDLSSTSM